MNFEFKSTFKTDSLKRHIAMAKIVSVFALTMARSRVTTAAQRLHHTARKLPVKSLLKKICSRHLLLIVLINAIPVTVLLWLYFGDYVVLAAVMSLHNSAWWANYQLLALALGSVHAAYSLAVAVQQRLPFLYVASLLIAFAPFGYAYWMYLHQVKLYSLTLDPRLNAALQVLNPLL